MSLTLKKSTICSKYLERYLDITMRRTKRPFVLIDT
jgi:hypothetical protein